MRGAFIQLEDDVEPDAGACAGYESVLWTSTSGDWIAGPGAATFEDSCVETSLATGTNTALSASPFVSLGSPEEQLSLDLAGLPRTWGTAADLGAYEEQGVSPPVSPWASPVDFRVTTEWSSTPADSTPKPWRHGMSLT